MDDAKKEKLEKFRKDWYDVYKEIQKISEDIKNNATDISERIKSVQSKVVALDKTAVKEGLDDFATVGQRVTIKDALLEVKRNHLTNYSERVNTVNSHIDELKANPGDLTPAGIAALSGLTKLPQFETGKVRVSSWRHLSYMKDFNYAALIAAERKVDEIKSNYSKKAIVEKFKTKLDDKCKHIENCLKEIDGFIKKEMPAEERKGYVSYASAIDMNIMDLEEKIADSKSKLSPEEYNAYMTRVSEYSDKIDIIKLKLSEEYKTYEKYSLATTVLNDEARSLNSEIKLRATGMSDKAITIFRNKIVALEGKITEFQNQLQQAYDKKEISEAIYKTFMRESSRASNIVKGSKKELGEVKPINVNEFDFVAVEIDAISEQLDKLESKVASFDKKKNSREERCNIEKLVKKISAAIEELEGRLERNKTGDEERYKIESQKLQSLKARLTKINNNYYRALPLRVRRVKSAKNFYKKHKKMVLFAVGLAAVALVHAIIGPVIIPAIMHGNLMLMYKIPGLSKILGGVNTLLAKVVHAKAATLGTKTVWQLASGVTINPAKASASILRGLAISSLGTAALGITTATLVSTGVSAVKELVAKMKAANLKKELADKDKKKPATAVPKPASPVTPTPASPSTPTPTREAASEGGLKSNMERRKVYMAIQNLFNKYMASGLTFDEFCKQEKLNDNMKEVLRAYEELFKGEKRGRKK